MTQLCYTVHNPGGQKVNIDYCLIEYRARDIARKMRDYGMVVAPGEYSAELGVTVLHYIP